MSESWTVVRRRRPRSPDLMLSDPEVFPELPKPRKVNVERELILFDNKFLRFSMVAFSTMKQSHQTSSVVLSLQRSS